MVLYKVVLCVDIQDIKMCSRHDTEILLMFKHESIKMATTARHQFNIKDINVNDVLQSCCYEIYQMAIT